MATVTLVRDLFRGYLPRETQQVNRRRTVRSLAPKGRACVAICNGRVLTRRGGGWDRRLVEHDHLVFVVLPRGGGGGSNPLKIVLTIALLVFAPYAAPALAGALGVSVGVATLGITAVGNFLIGKAFPDPKPSANSALSKIAAASPTYSIAAQGNAVRLDQPIPAHYGALPVYPDFACAPYARYESQEQYLYLFLCVGWGEFAVWDVQVGGVNLPALPGTAEWAVYEPAVHYDQANWYTSPDVASVDLNDGEWAGPVPLCPAGTVIDYVEIDAYCGKGLGKVTSSGITSLTYSLEIEVTEIGDDEAPIGTPVVLVGYWDSGVFYSGASPSYSAATQTPQRNTYRFALPSTARWSARVRRTDIRDTSNSALHDVSMTALRGRLVTGVSADDLWWGVTVVWVRLAAKAVAGLSNTRVNLWAERVNLPRWVISGGTGHWEPVRLVGDPPVGYWTRKNWYAEVSGVRVSNDASCSNPVWASLDIATNAVYGAGVSTAKLDQSELVSLVADIEAGPGCKTFDGRFDTQQGWWDALTQVCDAVRMRPFFQGGRLRFVRDVPRLVPAMLFSPGQIVAGSLALTYQMPSSEGWDGVEVQYFDRVLRRTRRVLVPIGAASTNPKPVPLFGVVTASDALAEGQYLARKFLYRRGAVSWECEAEGLAVSFGDLVAINHDLPRWGGSSEIVEWDSVGQIATVRDSVDVDGWPAYVAVRLPTGALTTHLAVSAPPSASGSHWIDSTRCVLPALASVIEAYGGVSSARPISILLSDSGSWSVSPDSHGLYELAIVTAIRPTQDLRCTIEAEIYDSRVWG